MQGQVLAGERDVFKKNDLPRRVSYYEERYRQRVLHNLRRKAEHLGFALVEAPVIEGVLRKVTAFFVKENS